MELCVRMGYLLLVNDKDGHESTVQKMGNIGHAYIAHDRIVWLAVRHTLTKKIGLI